MKLVACEILIPVVSDRTRQPFPDDVVQAWELQLAEKFGGYTRRGTVSGVWRDEQGQLVGDESACYLVAVGPAQLDDLRAFARAACETFDQRCIYFQIVGQAELLYPEE